MPIKKRGTITITNTETIPLGDNTQVTRSSTDRYSVKQHEKSKPKKHIKKPAKTKKTGRTKKTTRVKKH